MASGHNVMYVLMIDPESTTNSDAGLCMEDVDLLGVFETQIEAVRAVGLRLSDLKKYFGIQEAWSLTRFADGSEEEPQDLLLREVPIGRLLV